MRSGCRRTISARTAGGIVAFGTSRSAPPSAAAAGAADSASAKPVPEARYRTGMPGASELVAATAVVYRFAPAIRTTSTVDGLPGEGAEPAGPVRTDAVLEDGATPVAPRNTALTVRAGSAVTDQRRVVTVPSRNGSTAARSPSTRRTTSPSARPSAALTSTRTGSASAPGHDSGAVSVVVVGAATIAAEVSPPAETPANVAPSGAAGTRVCPASSRPQACTDPSEASATAWSRPASRSTKTSPGGGAGASSWP
ncbi:Uncharacterised protein [Mycobacteroides abscessus]|nr:Uncharacterised protein [Mycobacteroides abscessus]